MSKPITSVGQILSLMSCLKRGESFYTPSTPKSIMAYSGKLKVKVSTKTCLLIEDYSENPITHKLYKVTIL